MNMNTRLQSLVQLLLLLVVDTTVVHAFMVSNPQSASRGPPSTAKAGRLNQPSPILNPQMMMLSTPWIVKKNHNMNKNKQDTSVGSASRNTALYYGLSRYYGGGGYGRGYGLSRYYDDWDDYGYGGYGGYGRGYGRGYYGRGYGGYGRGYGGYGRGGYGGGYWDDWDDWYGYGGYTGGWDPTYDRGINVSNNGRSLQENIAWDSGYGRGRIYNGGYGRGGIGYGRAAYYGSSFNYGYPGRYGYGYYDDYYW